MNSHWTSLRLQFPQPVFLLPVWLHVLVNLPTYWQIVYLSLREVKEVGISPFCQRVSSRSSDKCKGQGLSFGPCVHTKEKYKVGAILTSVFLNESSIRS